jgi:hypothetical protein
MSRYSIPICFSIVTLSEQVGSCFLNAVTKGAEAVARPIFSTHIISCKNTVMHNQPAKKFTLWLCVGFSDVISPEVSHCT